LEVNTGKTVFIFSGFLNVFFFKVFFPEFHLDEIHLPDLIGSLNFIVKLKQGPRSSESHRTFLAAEHMHPRGKSKAVLFLPWSHFDPQCSTF
jgi:hypothetical protein